MGRFTGSGSATQWHNGYTVGAGWEYGVTQNWIVGLEYDYASFQTRPYQLAGNAAPLVYTFDAKPRDIQSVVARVSYKFDRAADLALLIAASGALKSPGLPGLFFAADLTWRARRTVQFDRYLAVDRLRMADSPIGPEAIK